MGDKYPVFDFFLFYPLSGTLQPLWLLLYQLNAKFLQYSFIFFQIRKELLLRLESIKKIHLLFCHPTGNQVQVVLDL